MEDQMLKHIRALLAPPTFPSDDDQTRRAKYAHVAALSFLFVSIVLEAAARPSSASATLSLFDLSMLLVACACLSSLALLRRGQVRTASVVLVAVIWLVVTGFGVHDGFYLAHFAIVLVAGLLLGWQGSLAAAVFSAVAGFALANAEENALISPISSFSFAGNPAYIFILNGILLYFLISGLESAFKKSRTTMSALESANAMLSENGRNLQARLSELTTDRDRVDQDNRMLQAIQMIALAGASVQEFEPLLQLLTGRIGELFSYHHVALFMLDQQEEFAVLRASNTADGQALLNKGFRVSVGQAGLIGLVLRTGQTQVAQKTSDSPGISGEYVLAETRAEIALPLKLGQQMIGILDLQAAEEHAFARSDISMLSLLADQVAILIQHAALYEETRSALHRADLAANQVGRQAWDEYGKAIQAKGYRYDGIDTEPLQDIQPQASAPETLSIPIQLRGQTIGRFRLNPVDPSRSWTDDELGIVKATADRVALALEGTRLLNEAEKRAAREAFLSELASKLSSSFRLESILRDTVEELGQTLQNTAVTFRLIRPASKSADYDRNLGVSDG